MVRLSEQFSGHGRLDRLGYLVAVLAVAVLFYAPLALLVPPFPTQMVRGWAPEAFDLTVVALGTAAWGAALWIYVAATARRLHDIGRSGWLAGLVVIPAVGLGALTLILLTAKGEGYTNRYGARWI